MNGSYEQDQATLTLEGLRDKLKSSRRISVLTGAGVSTASGIPDFQTVDREWPFSATRESLLQSSVLHRDPGLFWSVFDYLFSVKSSDSEPKPSAFHRVVARLEEHSEVQVVTQNVDGLHQKAGSTRVLEVHGSLEWLVCTNEDHEFAFSAQDRPEGSIPRCAKDGALLRPNVALFGDPVSLAGPLDAVTNSQVVVIAGTRLEVWPFAGLVMSLQSVAPGVKVYYLNRDAPPSGLLTYVNECIMGDLEDLAHTLED